MISCSYNKTSVDKPMSNDGDPSKILIINKDSINNKLVDANKNFKISDSLAIVLLLKVSEIKEIKNYDYKDNRTFNELTVIGIPDNSNPRWEIDMGQFQKNVQDKYYSFIRFWIDANTGEIEILDIDINVDDPISLDEWIKHKNRK